MFVSCLLFSVLLQSLSTVHCFILPNINHTQLTWSDAENYCVQFFNSHLLSIHDNDTLDEVRNTIQQSHQSFWIGLSLRHAEYEWSDSTMFDYGNTTQYPWSKMVNHFGDAHRQYIFLDSDHNWQWNVETAANASKHWLCNDAADSWAEPIGIEISTFAVIAGLLGIVCLCAAVLLCAVYIFRSFTRKHACREREPRRSKSSDSNIKAMNESGHEPNPSHSSQISSRALSGHEHADVNLDVQPNKSFEMREVEVEAHALQCAPTRSLNGEYDVPLRPDEFVVRGDDETDANLNGMNGECGEHKSGDELSAPNLVPLTSLLVEAHSFEELHSVLTVPAVAELRLKVGEPSVLPPPMLNGECSEGVQRANDDGSECMEMVADVKGQTCASCQ